MRGSRKVHGGPEFFFFKSSTYFTDGRTDLPREARGEGRRSIPLVLRKHVVTYDFPGGGESGQHAPSLDSRMLMPFLSRELNCSFLVCVAFG